MAAKRHDPTALGRKQIQSRFQRIFSGKLEFITVQNMKAWYGRYDDVAIEKLEAAWSEYCRSKKPRPRVVPKLFAVGPTTKPKGYAVGRRDKRAEWLYQ